MNTDLYLLKGSQVKRSLFVLSILSAMLDACASAAQSCRNLATAGKVVWRFYPALSIHIFCEWNRY
jgi:hypothetical protein